MLLKLNWSENYYFLISANTVIFFNSSVKKDSDNTLPVDGSKLLKIQREEERALLKKISVCISSIPAGISSCATKMAVTSNRDSKLQQSKIKLQNHYSSLLIITILLGTTVDSPSV